MTTPDTDHLAAIIAAAQCQWPVDCRNGHSDWCNAARKVAVRDAVREALGDAAVVEAVAKAVVHQRFPLDVIVEGDRATMRRALAAAVDAVGGAS